MKTQASSTATDLVLSQHLERAVAICGAEDATTPLADVAARLGWSPDRQLRMLGEDIRERVGSRIARGSLGLVLTADLKALMGSGADAARFLDLCALYDTLVGDAEGIYDPTSTDDRAALGVASFQDRTLEQRLRRGRLRKARHGKLGVRVPTGYTRDDSGAVIIDPHDDVRAAINVVFGAFAEAGNVGEVLQQLERRGIKLGFRSPAPGGGTQIAWRPANRQTLRNLLRNPIYAGAYVYGRRPGREPTREDAWKICLRDHHAAYIPWERFEENVQRLAANRSSARAPGVVRGGATLLTGLVYCARCGRRMAAQYPSGAGRYVCAGERSEPGSANCQSLAARTLDQKVLEAARAMLAPEVLAAHAKRRAAGADETVERRLRARLTWAQQQADIAERRYLAVDPENVRVASSLEREWEARLREQQSVEQELQVWRRGRSGEVDLTTLERLARETAGGWEALSSERRKRALRQMVERVLVAVRGESERVTLTVHWVWGEVTTHAALRPVARWEQMSTWPKLVSRLKQSKSEGMTARSIAAELNDEGWHTPRLKGSITPEMVRSLLSRHKITLVQRRIAQDPDVLGESEWWLPELSRALGVPASTLYGWLRRGQLKARQLHGDQGRWVIFMDEAERARLLELKKPRVD